LLQCIYNINYTYFYLFIYFILLLCLVGVHCDIYKDSYNISNILYVISSPPPFYFISPSPLIQKTVSTGIFLLFTIMSTQYLHHIHLLTSFPHLLSPLTAISPSPRQNLFFLPVLLFYKRKKKEMTFLLV
jgi:hypothetical protein